MTEWAVLIAIGVGTYLFRAAFLIKSGLAPSPAVGRYLKYVGPAVLAAIAVPALISPGGDTSWSATGPAVFAALVSWLLWRPRKSLPLALFGGLGCWWALLAIGSVI